MNPDVWITAFTILAMLALCLLRLRVERREDARRGRPRTPRDRDVQPPLR